MAATKKNPVERLDALALVEAPLGYHEFLSHLVINAQPTPAYFREIALDWQLERERLRVDAIDFAAGISTSYLGPWWFWSGYAKGHDKTPGVARRLLFLLAYARKPLELVVCAGDQDQASLITQAMRTTLAQNRWLEDRCEVSVLGGRGESGSSLSVLPMDAWTGQGISPDYIVADEVTHWQHKRGQEFWDFVLATVSKRPYCVFEVLTNAGFLDSWQHRARNWAEKSPLWSFYEQPPYSHMAEWMNREAIEEICKGMSPGEVKRVIRNVWIDPGEENGYLTTAEASACVDPTLEEQVRGSHYLNYFAIVDYGGVIDRCALCVLHPVPGSDKVDIDRLDCWQGTHESRVILSKEDALPGERTVEGWLDLTLASFPNCRIVCDPYQMEFLAQKYERRGRLVSRFEYRAGKRNMRMAQLLKEMIQNRRIRWSPQAGHLPGADDDTFAKELARLVLKPTIYGYRFDHESGRHDDRAAAVGMGLIFAVPETLPSGKLGVQAKTATPAKPTPGVAQPPHGNWAARRGLFGMK